MIRPQTCPVCKKALDIPAAESRFFPFCSERCQQIDMYRWCTGKYAIVEPLGPEDIEQDIETDAESE